MLVRFMITMHQESWKRVKALENEMHIPRSSVLEFVLTNYDPAVWEERIKEKTTQLETLRKLIERYRTILSDNGIIVEEHKAPRAGD